MNDAYELQIYLPQNLSIQTEEFRDSHWIDRQSFFDWLWGRFFEEGLLGVHEGTLLSEEASAQGLETESWTVDSAEAPPSRDWVGSQEEGRATLYFATYEQAKNAAQILQKISNLQISEIRKQEDQDWNAVWKASFLNEGRGVEIPPFWRIVPPWVENPNQAQLSSEILGNLNSKTTSEKWIRINPGAGFGTGTHETTQLCLYAIGDYALRNSLTHQSALDFGSGSGILSIAMALLGAQVDGVEVDSLAIDNARENAQLNGVEERIRFYSTLQDHNKIYPCIVANILRPVLLEFAESLVKKLHPTGFLILSGLIYSDVEPIVAKYCKSLDLKLDKIYEKGEWRALVLKT